MVTPNTRRVSLEKKLKASAATETQRDICEYVKLLRDKSYEKLLQGVEDQSICVGELRSLQKLLTVLELGTEPMPSMDSLS